MNGSYFPALDHAIQDMNAAKSSYNTSMEGANNYGGEGAAKDAMNEEFEEKLSAIKARADELMGGMMGGRRRGGKSRKAKKSRKASKKARKTRRR